jgi:rhamnogalacturonyl hydrolase YesR
MPRPGGEPLDKILTMFRELRERDRIATLNMFAAELKILGRSIQALYMAAIQHHIWWNIKKHGVVLRCVAHVAHNTRYEQIVVQGWVQYVNQIINIGGYTTSDIVIINKMNLYFNLAFWMTVIG